MPDLADREARIRRSVTPQEIELDTPEYWEWMRGLGKGEAYRLSARMTTMLCDDVHGEIAVDHPDWDDKERKIEFVKRMYGPTLAGHLRRWMDKEKHNGDSD
jgi:hypothetical protein